MRRLVGRDAERESIGRFLADAGGGPWALLIDGEAGIGKTALWRAVLADADALVLATRATEQETALAFAALTDLLAAVPAVAIAGLPAPQRTALEVATLRRAPGADPVDARAVATGLGTLLGRLAEERPVVVALDDVQWLDGATLRAVEFAVRRLGERHPAERGTGEWQVGERRVGVLATVRSPHERVPVIGAIDAAAVPVHTVVPGPLSMAALHHVIRDELGQPLPRPALVRVVQASGGNPMFALELARALRRGGAAEPGAPLPVPDTLRGLTTGRLAALTAAAREALLVAAMAPRPTVELLHRLGHRDGLREAEAAGIVEVRAGRVEFEHPLLAAAAVDGVPRGRLRTAHAALAVATEDAEQRARHLALAAEGPSESVAAALDAAVGASRARGATAAAAELARLAVDHTPDAASAAALRRTAMLGDLLYEAGDAPGARACYRAVLDGSPDPLVRARAGLQLAELLWVSGARAECVSVCHAALLDAAGDANLTARVHLCMAALPDATDAVRHTNRAREVLDEASAPDPRLLAWAILQEATNRFNAGSPLDVAALDRALALERTGRQWRSTDQVAMCHPVLLKYADHFEAALRGLDKLRQRAVDEGNDGYLPFVVGHYPMLLLRMGSWDAASRSAAEHLELAEASGQAAQVAQAHMNLAAVALHQGRFDDALASAETVLGIADGAGDRGFRMTGYGLCGSIRLQQGDAAGALGFLERWWELNRGVGEYPFASRYHADYAEALLATGDTERAAAFVAETEAAARRAGRTAVVATMARARAVLAAARGDLAGALAAAGEAMALHDAVSVPFDRARTLLVKGQLHRRAKEKLLARAALAEALETFASLGSPHWVARTRAELDRVNIRPPAPTELTATERRIAELAAGGMTNRQIAAAAFVSPKTVEANLARIYRKLGIASRAELGSRMAAHGAANGREAPDSRNERRT